MYFLFMWYKMFFWFFRWLIKFVVFFRVVFLICVGGDVVRIFVSSCIIVCSNLCSVVVILGSSFRSLDFRILEFFFFKWCYL